MSVEIQIDSGRNIATIIITGEYGADDIPHMLDALIETRGFVRGMNSVVDLRHGRLSAGPGDLSGIADLFLSRQIRRGHSFRIAFLTGDDFTYGLCRMVSVALEQVPIYCRVVRTSEAANSFVCEIDDAMVDFESA